MILANRTRFRRGFTLIELLVVMALIAGLAAIAMVVAPGAINKDRASTAVSQIQSALQISRARAIRDGVPRGIRFVNTGNTAIEYQYIEAIPMIVPNPGAPLGLGIAPFYSSSPPLTGTNAPYVQFNYSPATGPVTSRTCTINGLSPTDQAQVVVGGSLYLPTLSTLHYITAVSGTTVTLDSYPDQQLGAELQWRTYHFGLNGGVRTLLGEPTIQLPVNTCVDLGLSSPLGGAGMDYDILFTPSGLIDGKSTPSGAGQIFLWVRDPNKPRNLNQGGEQLLVSIKAKTGGIGAAPVDWGPDRYFLAKKALSGQ